MIANEKMFPIIRMIWCTLVIGNNRFILEYLKVSQKKYNHTDYKSIFNYNLCNIICPALPDDVPRSGGARATL